MKIDAILWDYDGTLVNSVPKNIAITKRILSEVTPHLTGENLPPCLSSEALYHKAVHQSTNWQDLYTKIYGMTEAEMLEAGSLWTPYQLENTNPVSFFPGIKDTIAQIEIPQAICSLNTSKIINRVIKDHGISQYFKTVIGYNDVPMDKQKPHAFGGIKCLNEMFDNNSNKNIIYIGDHEVDVEFSRNMAREIGEQNRVISVIVKYSGAETSSWSFKPDFEIETPSELLSILNSF